MKVVGVAWAFVLAAAVVPVWAQPATPEGPVPPAVILRQEADVVVRAVRVEKPPSLDGRLDEDLYRTTLPIDGFIQQEPSEGAPASEPTEAWVFFDERNVYVSARCFDSQPDRDVLTELRRDNNNIIIQNENSMSETSTTLRMRADVSSRISRCRAHSRWISRTAIK